LASSTASLVSVEVDEGLRRAGLNVGRFVDEVGTAKRLACIVERLKTVPSV